MPFEAVGYEWELVPHRLLPPPAAVASVDLYEYICGGNTIPNL